MAQRAEPLFWEVSSRLRGALYEGRLRAIYHSRSHKKLIDIDQGFWAGTDADGVFERGWFEPWGSPSVGGQPYFEPLFVFASELSALLTRLPTPPKAEAGPPQAANLVRTRGPRPTKRESVKARMREFVAQEGWQALHSMKQVALEETFKASRDTCSKALGELSTETPTEPRQTPTNNK